MISKLRHSIILLCSDEHVNKCCIKAKQDEEEEEERFDFIVIAAFPSLFPARLVDFIKKAMNCF